MKAKTRGGALYLYLVGDVREGKRREERKAITVLA